jgi:predicted Zn-dependent protease
MITRLFVVFLLVLLAGCQTRPAEAPAPDAPDIHAAEAPIRPFDADTLYTLLTGEIALHRDMYSLALGSYLQQAQATRDPGVAARATEIAAALNASAATAQAALLWSELEPDNARAHFMAAMGLQQQGQLEASLDQMLISYRLAGLSRFAALATEVEDPAFRQRMTAAVQPLLKKDPDNIDLLQADALLSFANGDFKRALASCQQVLAVMPDNLPTVALESSILIAMGRTDEALSRFIALMDEQPDNLRLQIEYARTLSRISPTDAQREFTELSRQHPQHPELLLSMALLARENGDIETSTDAFRRLLVLGHYRNEANFYLGVAAADADDADSAVAYLKAVTPGNAFLQSRRIMIAVLLENDRLMEVLHQLRSDLESLPDTPPYKSLRLELSLMEAEALLQHNRPKESLDVLDAIGKRFGDKSALFLYTRSLAYEKLGRFADAERDLRTLLADNPDDATALNALGYSLANRSERLPEALQLIQHAARLEPDDPAITDSLGWVYFRMGQTQKALNYLQTAFTALPDAEIGAHLGEVLWVQGQQAKAREIWTTLYYKQPQSPVLRETVERLTGLPLEALADEAP